MTVVSWLGVAASVVGIGCELLALRSVRELTRGLAVSAGDRARAVAARLRPAPPSSRVVGGVAAMEAEATMTAHGYVLDGDLAVRLRGYTDDVDRRLSDLHDSTTALRADLDGMARRVDEQTASLSDLADDARTSAAWIVRGLVAGGVGVLLAAVGQVT